MRILVNNSNLGMGGAMQVADSFCSVLVNYSDFFIVVLPPSMEEIYEKIKNFSNVKVVFYKITNNWKTYLLARDTFLDNLVDEENVDFVFSVFAPTWWTPKRPHLCGFALAHLVMPESPFFKSLSFRKLLQQKIQIWLLTYFYRRSSKYYYTENPMISSRLKNLLHCQEVFTVTNYYNQVFDIPKLQRKKEIPVFEGLTMLTITRPYPHKNTQISLEIARILKQQQPEFMFRFVFTFA